MFVYALTIDDRRGRCITVPSYRYVGRGDNNNSSKRRRFPAIVDRRYTRVVVVLVEKYGTRLVIHCLKTMKLSYNYLVRCALKTIKGQKC